ncbi:hypothetical protein [Vibrio gigantis]|uniref:hypothetical protein n=1 Tax=Vibrio gigantis TaxID=296199 RepID=UPI001BFE0793|nr:hypothetical protein [Vibrio gigantis]
MYKKIHEKKFRSSQEATDYADKSGWNYVGYKGMLRKYHLYTGVIIGTDEQVFEDYQLRLDSDGHVALYTNSKLGSTTLISRLPEYVWASEDLYRYSKQLLNEANQKLRDEYDNWFSIVKKAINCFSVHAHEKVEGELVSSSIVFPALIDFSTLQEALEWAIYQVENDTGVGKKTYRIVYDNNVDFEELYSEVESIGWVFEKKQEIMSANYFYIGVIVNESGQITESLRLRLYSKGKVMVFADASVSNTQKLDSLPEKVWGSLEDYKSTHPKA